MFWDKRDGIWRAAVDDPDSALYAESSDAETVIAYIMAHSGQRLASRLPATAPASGDGHGPPN